MNDETSKITIPENAIDRETAENEFDRWVEAMSLDLDQVDFDENDRRDIQIDKERIIRSIQKGKIEINDDGLIVYTPEGGRPLTFHRPKGADLTVMDKKKYLYSRILFCLLQSPQPVLLVHCSLGRGGSFVEESHKEVFVL